MIQVAVCPESRIKRVFAHRQLENDNNDQAAAISFDILNYLLAMSFKENRAGVKCVMIAVV